jgi:lathosterol oxidase
VLLNEIYQVSGMVGVFLALSGFGMVLYLVLAGLSYGLFFVRWRQRYHPAYQANRRDLLRSVRWSLYSITGNALLMLPIEWLILRGQSRIYEDVALFGWVYLSLSVAFVLVITETLIYWIHRGLHLPFLFRRLHAYHHRFREPTPLAGVAFHPLDSFSQALPYHLCVFLLPLHSWVYHGFVVLVTVWAVLIHDRICWVPIGIVNHTGCHMVHHWYYAHNYGQFFTFWDRWCGTYRSSADLPERFFAAWPRDKQKAREPVTGRLLKQKP